MRRLSYAWIFVSHSTQDLEHVRRIRDELERREAQPLLFFLKCLDEQEELRILLRREIEARNFFLLCDSSNARSSRWVREEQEYVRSLPEKQHFTIDLDSDWDGQIRLIDEMHKSVSVFLSYARADLQRVMPFADMLTNHDFAVWTDVALQAGTNWQAAIEQALRDAAHNGYLVAFLSSASLQSAWAAAEVATFQLLQKGGQRLILADLEPIEHLLPTSLQGTQRLYFYKHDDATNEVMLLQALGIG